MHKLFAFKEKYTLMGVILLILIINIFGLFEAIDEEIYNNYTALNRDKEISKNIVIVEIDNKSIKMLGRWPWNRTFITEGINKLVSLNPSVIGIYITFTEPQEKKVDIELHKALKSFPNIVLAAKLKDYNSNNILLKLPEESIFSDITHGHTALKYSDKGKVISIPARKVFYAFALEVIKHYFSSFKYPDSIQINNKLAQLLANNNDDNFSKYDFILIDYKKTPDMFKHISFIDLLKNRVAKSDIENKIVLIGVTDKLNSPFFATPFTGKKVQSSTGVQLQAQIIDSFINFRNLQKCPEIIIYLFSILLAIIFYLITKNKRILIKGIILSIAVIVLALLSYILFTDYAIWFPPALPLILIITLFGFSLYYTTSRVDDKLITVFKKINQAKNLPVFDLPDDITGRVDSLSTLLEIINSDRQTIKSIIDGVKNGLIVFDLNGKITWANTRILDIFSDQMVLNQYLYELLTDINFEVLLEEIKRFNIFITDIAIQQLEFKCVITPISIEPVHYVAVFNDITDLKKIDRLKSDMIRMVSHELKNPLLAINICAENIVDIQEKNFVIENAQNIIQASSVLMNIITNFLNLSRLENNMIEFNKEPADLIEIINECISLQLPIAKEKGIDIIFENENIAEVLIDKTQITIVINNLLSNALKYSINSNKVIVKTYTEEEFIKTSIIDFGIGIPQEDLDKIFETFFRSINNKKNNIEGSGLGLSIIKRILLLHNGDISVTSKVNEGSIFTFKLPAQNLSTAINQETK